MWDMGDLAQNYVRDERFSSKLCGRWEIKKINLGAPRMLIVGEGRFGSKLGGR